MMGIERELKEAAATLERCNATAISLRAGCELFLRFATRTSALELPDFDAAKARIVDVSIGEIGEREREKRTKEEERRERTKEKREERQKLST